MGFPEVMYLSRGQVRQLWPHLPLKPERRKKLSAVLHLSVVPSLEVSGGWEGSDRPDRPSREEWPPWEAPEIVEAIERYVSKKRMVGSNSSLQDPESRHKVFLLQGRLRFAAENQTTPRPYRSFLDGGKTNMIQATFELVQTGPGQTSRIPRVRSENEGYPIPPVSSLWLLELALENIAGLHRTSTSRWEIAESGANFLFRFMEESHGYPTEGLFTYVRPSETYAGVLRAIFFRPSEQ